MNIKTVTAVFFSPTGNARRIAEAAAGQIAARAGAPLRTIDITLPQARKQEKAENSGPLYRFSPEDLAVFCTPVYAGRIPNKLLPAFQTLFEGNGALAVPVVTFGNRSYDNALIELCKELEAHGFHTIAGGAFVSEHVFSKKLAPGRPDAEDMREILAFADAAARKAGAVRDHFPKKKTGAVRDTSLQEKAGAVRDASLQEKTGAVRDTSLQEKAGAVRDAFLQEKAGSAADNSQQEKTAFPAPVRVRGEDPIPGYYRPLGADGKPAVFLKAKPRTSDACSGCGLCAKVCPMGSISPEDCRSVPGICIKCHACVKICPEHAKYFDDPALLSHILMLEQNYARRARNETFL